jgi:DNA-binding CsgD family transcriptional regulator
MKTVTDYTRKNPGPRPQVPAEVIRSLAARSRTRKEIAAELEVSYRTVAGMVERYKIDVAVEGRLPERLSAEAFGGLVRILASEGWTAAKIARYLGASPPTVRKYLRETTL